MDDTSQRSADEAGAEESKPGANELSNYLKAEREEEEWLERMQAAAKARKAKEKPEE